MTLRTFIASSPSYTAVLICLFSILYLSLTRQPVMSKAKIKKAVPQFQLFDRLLRRWIFIVVIVGCFAGFMVSLAYGTYTAFPVVVPLSAMMIFDAVLSLKTNIYSKGWENYVYDKAQKLRWLGFTEIGLAILNILYCVFIYFIYLK